MEKYENAKFMPFTPYQSNLTYFNNLDILCNNQNITINQIENIRYLEVTFDQPMNGINAFKIVQLQCRS